MLTQQIDEKLLTKRLHFPRHIFGNIPAKTVITRTLKIHWRKLAFFSIWIKNLPKVIFTQAIVHRSSIQCCFAKCSGKHLLPCRQRTYIERLMYVQFTSFVYGVADEIKLISNKCNLIISGHNNGHVWTKVAKRQNLGKNEFWISQLIPVCGLIIMLQIIWLEANRE